MSDIVKRLRAEVTENRRYEVTGTLALEAADRIEQLEAALLPFASIKTDDGHDYISTWPDTVIVRCEASVREIKAARAALEEK